MIRGFKRLVVAFALLSACTSSSSGVEGSSVAGSDRRTVAAFDRLDTRGSFAVEVEVGPAVSVRIDADDNVVPLISTEVSGSTLTIAARGSFSTTRPITVSVTTPTLVGVSHSGSGSVRVRGISDLNGINDSNDINDIRGGSFAAALDGSGSLELAGEAGALTASVDGSGSLAAVDLVTRRATVALSGSGGAEVHATEQVVAALNGSGSVRHAGGAKDVVRQIHGSGSVEPM